MTKFKDLERELSDGDLSQKFVSFCSTFSPPFIKTSFKNRLFCLFQINFFFKIAPAEIANADFAGDLFRDHLFNDDFLVIFFNWSDRLGKIPLQKSMLVSEVLLRQLDLNFIS
jgi:hypothetical protein